MKTVRVFAPATVSNVNCGFDVLGFAMEGPGDEVEITLTKGKEVRIVSIEPQGVNLTTNARKNTSGVAILSFLDQIGERQGVDIVLKKNLPLGSGMGSSGASAAAALVAINHAMGNPLTKEQLVPHAMEAERMACGSAHADNVAPSILGGFVLIRSYNPLDVVHIPSKADLWCTLVHPHLELRTEDSRRVLKSEVPLKDTITQTGNIAALMIGLMMPDYKLISRSLVDVVAEPLRSGFIPGFSVMKSKSSALGALGFGISGSGPSVFALSITKEIAEAVGIAIHKEFSAHDISSDQFISAISGRGARVID